MMLSFEVMAPLMFAGLILFLLLGYPVAFSLGFVGLGFGALATWAMTAAVGVMLAYGATRFLAEPLLKKHVRP